MTKPDSQCDIAIIGGGVSGLYAADRLHQLLPNHTVRIFERTNAVGGRILSEPLTTLQEHVDLGAGRYNARRHLRLHKLIGELGIPCAPFDYDIAPFQNGLFDSTREKIRELCKELRCFFEECTPKDQECWSFWEGASRYLGDIKSAFIIAASGYDSLRNPKLPFKHGMDILLNHPETSSLASDVRDEWLAPMNGFQSVPERLASNLARVCPIEFHCSLRAIQPLPAGSRSDMRLHFESAVGKKIVETKQVIHASSLHDFLQVDGCRLSAAIARNIVDVPLIKGCVEYEVPWWQSMDIAGRCFTNSSPFRKVYFPRRSPYLLIYADGEAAIALRELAQDRDRALKQFESVIRNAIPFDLLDGIGAQPVGQRWQFWERGISFWDGGLNLFPDDMWSYAPNIHVCSDLFTEHVGWVEGGIVSAEAAVSRVASQLQRGLVTRTALSAKHVNVSIQPPIRSSLMTSLQSEVIGPTV